MLCRLYVPVLPNVLGRDHADHLIKLQRNSWRLGGPLFSERHLVQWKPEMLGYLTKIERGNPTASGQFLGSRNFLSEHRIIDAIPNRPVYDAHKNVAWAALCAQGYGNGNYVTTSRRYAIASDKLFARACRRRLAFLPDEKKIFNRMRTTLASRSDAFTVCSKLIVDNDSRIWRSDLIFRRC